MQNLARKAYVFASFLIAGTALASVSAHASTHKIAHSQHVAAAHHHSAKRVASTHHTSHSKTHQTVASASHQSAAHKERVTYTVRRHGKLYTRTVWRTRTHDAQVSSGVYHGYLECVPYARKVSGIALSGNAATWWNEAPGRYERGHAPASGAVLNFRANGRMRLGHVAVVQEVVNRREILITQANWGGPGFVRGGVSSDISVVDVSPGNDWTAVRMALGHSPTYGSVYPTYGFIYQDGAPATRMAEADPAPLVDLGNRPPADLRNSSERRRAKSFAGTIQYASAPSFDGPAIATSAPDRNLR
jgi:surface antigen